MISKIALIAALYLGSLSPVSAQDLQDFGIVRLQKMDGIEYVVENKTEQMFIRVRRIKTHELLGSIVFGKYATLKPLVKSFESQLIHRACSNTEYVECRWVSKNKSNRLLLMRRLDNPMVDAVYAEYKKLTEGDAKVMDQIYQHLVFNEEVIKTFPALTQ